MEVIKDNERLIKAKRLEYNSVFAYKSDEIYLIKVTKNKNSIEVSLASDGSNIETFSSEKTYLKWWQEIEELKASIDKKFILEISYENNKPKLKIANTGVPYTDIITMLSIAKQQHINSLISAGE